MFRHFNPMFCLVGKVFDSRLIEVIDNICMKNVSEFNFLFALWLFKFQNKVSTQTNRASEMF